jgi:hypothetical protein
MSSTGDIIEKIRKLTKEKGYIYSFCQILLSDFFLELQKLHEINHGELVSINEASLIMGFLIQDKINFELPEDANSFLKMKQDTYKLLKELHSSFNDIFVERLKKEYLKSEDGIIKEKDSKNFWLKDNMWIEPLFYSDSGIYDFQYLEYLNKKYKYDTEWLIKNKNYDLGKTKSIVTELKQFVENKEQFSSLIGFNIHVRNLIEKIFSEKKGSDMKYVKIKNEIESFQYLQLFNDHSFKKYCVDLLSLFLFKKSDFTINDLEHFLINFSIKPGKKTNSEFGKVGDYNTFDSHPIVKLNNNIYFFPITFALFKAVYENPYYWMLEDNSYKDIASNNRGKVGEEIFYEILKRIFLNQNTYKSVKIKSNKSETITDIDVLCILGNKALCVQIKSKKLTLLSKQGSILQIQKDFREAIQEAFEQGLKCKEQINLKNSSFVDENGTEIILPEQIDDCYIMCGTTEVYHALNFQLEELLHKKEDDPYPIGLSIFDLELIAHYLSDPYSFLYYIRQRTTLAEYYKSISEIDLLGYHLTNKIYKPPDSSIISVDSSFAQLIDRNYYPYKAGLNISNKGDVLTKRWYNKDFENLCDELKTQNVPKFTDLLFQLFDLSGDSQERFISFILKSKRKTINDNKNHNFSFVPNRNDDFGLSYYSINNDNFEELKTRLTTYCIYKKYECKANKWIGFGSLMNSTKIIDTVFMSNSIWQYDSELEYKSKRMLEGRGQLIRTNKVGRNKMCSCGSMKKYKYCCGKNK